MALLFVLSTMALMGCSHTHSMTAHSSKEATCTTAGNMAYWECTDCGKYFSDEAGAQEIAKDSWIIAAKGHTLKAYEAAGETCTAAGNTAYWECTACGKYFSDEAGMQEIAKDSWIIAAKGHTLKAYEAAGETCTAAGNTAYWECTTCGKYFSDEAGAQEIAKDSWVIAAKGHMLTAHEAIEATCTTAGNKAYWECKDCGKYFSDEAGAQEIAKDSWVIAAKGHTLTAHEAIEATCTTAGNKAYWECKDCGKYFSDEAGTQEIAKDSWIIAAKGHTLTAHEAAEETCTTDGNTAYWECTACGKYFSDEAGTQEIEKDSWVIAAQHNYQLQNTVTADCTSDGIEHYVCTRCDSDYYVRTGERAAHTFGENGICTSCGKNFQEAVAVSVNSEDNCSVAVSDATYGYMVYAYDSTSYVHTVTVGREVLEEAVKQGYYTIKVQFGSPDTNYRIFGYKLQGQTSVKYLNCFTYNGFGSAAYFEIMFADPVKGMDESLVSEKGLEIEIFYRFAGNETISSEEAANNAGAYTGTLGKYILKITYDPFDPENAATYVTSGMTVTGSGNTLILGGTPTGAGYVVTISPKAINYWMNNGVKTISFRFGQKEGQSLALRLLSLPNFTTPYDANGTLTVREYALTESMRTSGLNIGIYFRDINNQNDKVDGMIFTVMPDAAADAEDPSTWIFSDFELSYNAETKKFTMNGNSDSDKRLVILRGGAIAAMMEQGYTKVKLSFTKINSNQTPYLKATGDVTGDGNMSLTRTIELTQEFAENGMQFSIQYNNLTLQNPAWGGTEAVTGFNLQVTFE